MTASVAHSLAATLEAYGVRRLFGVPGGGSSLDVIAAVTGRGIDFVLTKTETAAAIMAAVTGELSGSPGVVLTGLGPGAASAVNGIAYAALDRAPLLMITDAAGAAETGPATHQILDQPALLSPVAKASRRVTAGAGIADLGELLDLALAHPHGPVLIELTPESVAAEWAEVAAPPTGAGGPAPLDEMAVAAARARLAASRRPVVLAGLQTRDAAAASALRAFVRDLGCPVLTTFKAKGVVPDDDPSLVGLFTSAAAEADCVGRADAILFCGLDPVELLPTPWRYGAPVIDIAEVPGQPHHVEPEVAVIGPLAQSLPRLEGAGAAVTWTADEIAGLRGAIRERLTMDESAGVSPQRVVEAVRAAAPAGARVTVDAGAHMIPAMVHWPAADVNDVLISNGLSTMGFALPAAIAAALETPARHTIAFTGDGGLAMCLAELATAAALDVALTVVVFNDAALSLIDIKQQARGLPRAGVGYPAVDFARAAEGLGCRGYRAGDNDLADALDAAFSGPGPALVDVRTDPSAYPALLKALRG